jgi:hypothetical protein
VPVLPSWLTEPLWNQFIALLPERPAYAPTHPLGCHRPRISDRVVFDKMLQLLRFGRSYQAIADTTCSATTIRNRRDEWACQNAFHRLARCYERRATVIDAFFDIADTIITVRSLIRRAWTTHRWEGRPRRRP